LYAELIIIDSRAVVIVGRELLILGSRYLIMPFFLASKQVRLKKAVLFPGREGIVTFTFVGTSGHIL